MIRGLTLANPWNRNRIVPMLRTAFQKAPERVAIQLVWDTLRDFPKHTSLRESFEGVELLARDVLPFADVWVILADSYSVASVSVEEMKLRARMAVDVLGTKGVVFVCGNEVNGVAACESKKWCDPLIATKTRAALSVCQEKGATTAVCYYLFGDRQNQMLNWAEREQLNANFAMVSWYPFSFDLSVAQQKRLAWNAIFSDLAHAVRQPDGSPAWVGLGEFGCDGLKNPKTSDRISMITRLYGLEPDVPWYAGGGFYWYGSDELKANGPVWKALVNELTRVRP